MSNTYTQVHIHAVFTVQNRECIIRNQWKDELYKYITGIIRNNNHKLQAINGMPDHIHILFGMRPTQSLSEIMQLIKANSSKWINEQKFIAGRFSWQEGCAAFSYNKSLLPNVINYIARHEELHTRKTFIEEYKEILDAFEIEYNERFLFHPVEY
ncbi:MAG: IS200/IS605 family transposase [bacterium]